MITPYDSAMEYLWDELARVELLVRASVAKWSHDQTASGKPHHHWGLVHVSDEEVANYLQQGLDTGGQVVEVPAVGEFHRTYLHAGTSIEARRSVTPGAETFRLSRLSSAFDLDPLDVALLLLTMLPEVDHRYRLIYGYLQNDASRDSPCVELLTQLASPIISDPGCVPSKLAAGGRLCAEHLVRIESSDHHHVPPGRRRVIADDRIIRFLFGDDTPGDHPLSDLTLIRDGNWENCIHSDERLSRLRQIGKWCAGRADESGVMVFMQGASGSGRRTVACAIASDAGVPTLTADVPAVLGGSEPSLSIIDLIYREARLRKAAVLWHDASMLLDGDRASPTWKRILSHAVRSGQLTFVVTEQFQDHPESSSSIPELRISLPHPDFRTRVRLWKHYLPESGEFADPQPDRDAMAESLAAAFQLTPGQIVNSVATASASATVRDPAGGLLLVDELTDGCRRQSGRRLTELATRIEPRAGHTFDDLVLATPNRRQLDELRSRIALRSRMAEMGLEERLPQADSLLVMFTGSSGTGKTMAAELLAREQGVDLYKIDLAEVVSKYVGDTEKNLQRVFQEAEDANAIIFFDEADALFGKRGEVRDARDRWANIEINFLLQRVEQFSGVVILATNLRQNIDEAFLRRIHVVVEFPFPDADARYEIWSGILPLRDQIAGPSDSELRDLAERFRLPGGSIRNVAVDAGFRALASGGHRPYITMRQIAVALAREYQKLGRPLTVAEFGTHLYQWVESDVLMSQQPPA